MNNLGPLDPLFARCCHKSRAKSKITLRDKLYESLEEFNLIHDRARSAAEPSKNTTKNVTKTLELMIFAHMQNLVGTYTFSNEISRTPRVFHKFHMVCGFAHTQPQPKRIGVTRVMAKNRPKTTNNFGP